MNRADFATDPQDTFSLPNGFFQNPGGGNIKPGLKPVNSGVGSANSNVRANSRPNPANRTPLGQPPANGSYFNQQIAKQPNNNSRTAQQARQAPNLIMADGRYPNPNSQFFGANQQNNIPPFSAKPTPYPINNFYPQNQQPRIDRQTPANLPPHPNNALLNHQNQQFLPQHISAPDTNLQAQHAQREHQLLMAESEAHIAKENHYTNTLIVAIGALFLYFIGTFIIIFTSNVGGQTIVNLPTYKLTWELLFSNPAQLFTNLFLSVFGYFFQYARLFGFFPELGNLTVAPVERYLMPVDILIKLGTILYFNFRWMPWDTKKRYEDGCFNSTYPYLENEDKVKAKSDDKPKFELQSINIPAVELEKQTKVTAKPETVATPLPASNQNNYSSNFEDDDDEEDDHGILPFSGVQKPIEEWYYENETKIYGFIRTQVLPGSNMVLALYFSTLRVLDLRQPAFILFYILGIMSMFWCMQTFLLILDHNQYPPDEE